MQCLTCDGQLKELKKFCKDTSVSPEEVLTVFFITSYKCEKCGQQHMNEKALSWSGKSDKPLSPIDEQEILPLTLVELTPVTTAIGKLPKDWAIIDGGKSSASIQQELLKY